MTDMFDKIDIYAIKSNVKKVKASFVAALDLYCTRMGCKKPTPDLPKPAPSKIEVIEAPKAGGEGGVPFQYYLPTPLVRVKSFLVHYDVRINGLQLLMTDGVKTEYSPRYGLPNGNYYVW